MRKILPWLFIILAFVSACRKIENGIGSRESNNLASSVRSFIDELSNQHGGMRKSELELTLSQINLSSIERRYFDKDQEILVADINDVDVNSFVPGAKNTVQIHVNGSGKSDNLAKETKAVFYMREDKVVDGNIIEISSLSYSRNQIGDEFGNIIHARNKDFSGNLNVNFLDRRPCNNFVIRNGITISSTILTAKKPRSGSSNGTSVNAEYCIDWYWVTKFYWSDGSITQSEQYVNTTCGESIAPNQGDGSYSTPTDSLCLQARKIANDTAFAGAISNLSARLSDPLENGYRMVRSNLTGNFSYSFVAGTAAGVNPMTNYTGKMDGFIHNHITGLEPTFSLTDLAGLYFMYANNKMNNPSTFTLAVLLPNNKIQILRISDVATFANFGASYLTSSTFSAFVANATGFSSNNTYEQETNAFLAAIAGSGLTLYEADASALSNGVCRLEPPDNSIIAIKRTFCNN